MSTLTGTKIKDTYPSLLKLINNGSLQTSMPTIISDGLGNVTPLQIAETRIQTQYSAVNIGLDLSFTNNRFTIGDYDTNATGVFLQVDVNNQYIITKTNIGYKGIFLDFAGDSYQLGDVNGTTNGCLFIVDNNNSTIKTMKTGVDKGLRINFPSRVYSLGDYNATDNGTSVVIDDTAETVTITADQDLVFTGAGMESTGAGSPAPGKYLRIILNGGEYKIELLDP